MASSAHPSYRADIDGLRAVAVVAVVLFHGFPTLLRGGFVGVDVFFVISGYLITGILLANLDRGRLRLFDFYRHRVRRIFPALIIVLATCFAVGWLVLFADEYTQFGKHLAASAVFVSNIALWSEAGYFDVSAATKPLLHLWSLAVEEQFYVLWPPLLWLAWKLRIAPLWLAGAGAALSFAVCVALDGRDPAADFFSPAARFWEILLGAMLISAQRRHLSRPGRTWRTMISVAGGALIGASVLLLDGSMNYPGWRAAAPAMGSLLVLAAGPDAWLNRRVLACRPLVWIGLISYPLYLWHWPLLAFARILLGATPSAETRAALLAASLVLAMLTYAAVERPLRFGGYATLKTALLCGVLLLLGGAGLDDWQRDGLRFRYVVKHTPLTGVAAISASRQFTAGCLLGLDESINYWCVMDAREPPAYAIIGDSKAEVLFWGLLRSSEPHGRWLLVARPGCSPMAGMQRVTRLGGSGWAENDLEQCAAFDAAALRYVVQLESIRVAVIVVARRHLEHQGYALHADDPPDKDGALKGLSNLVDVLEKAGKRVVFLHDNPDVVGESADCIVRRTGIAALDEVMPQPGNERCNPRYDSYVSDLAGYRTLIEALKAAHPAMTVFDPTLLLCDPAANRCPMWQDGDFLYSYADHYSAHGSRRIAASLQPVIDNLGKHM